MARYQSPNVLRALGPCLAKARLARGLKAHEAAAALEVSQDTLTGWELSRTEPRASQLMRLAVIYHVDPGLLLVGVVSILAPNPSPPTKPGE